MGRRNPLRAVENIVRRTRDASENVWRGIGGLVGLGRTPEADIDTPEPITPPVDDNSSLITQEPETPETNIQKPTNSEGNLDTSDSGLGEIESVFGKAVANPFDELLKKRKKSDR